MTNNQTDLKFAGVPRIEEIHTKSHSLHHHLVQQQREQESPYRS